MAHSTNLMFQGQDIAMMALMGQSPTMLALQQGTQVGGIFAQMGSGRAVVQGLTSALGMMLNPLNLATIAFIGLGAAGVQSLMGMIGSTEDATDALETHGEWLDRVLVGYEAAALAARNAADQAMKLPQASVEADTEARHRRALEEQARAIEYLVRKQEDLIERRDTLALGGGLFGDIIRETEQLATFAMSVDMSADEVDRLHSIATKLVNDANVDEETRLWAQGFLDAANEARAAAKDVQQLDAAIRTLPRDVQIRLRVSTEFNNAVAGIASLYRDPRNQFDQDREILKNWLDHANATAQTYGELVGIGNQYTRVLESINAAEEEANKKANARAAKDAAKPFDQWGTAADNFTRGMEQQRMELELLGASTYEIARQRAEFDLLTQAKQAGVDLNMQLAGSEQTVAEWIKQSSAEYAALAVEMERQQEIASGITRFNSMIASTFVDVVMGAKDAGEAFQQLANQLISMAMNRLIMDMLGMMFGMPPGVGGAGIGGRGGLFGGAIIPGILHSGGEAGQDGYGHGRSFPAGLWRNAPRYHNGGVAGLLPNEVPAILQRGERVIPANQNGTQVVKIVLQDDSGRMAQIADQRIETAAGVIVEVSVAQSVRAVRNNQAKMSAEANLRYG